MQRIFLLYVLMIMTGLYCQNDDRDNINIDQYMSKIRVTIGGNTDNSGTYSAARNEKLDQFVTRMLNSLNNSSLDQSNIDKDQSKLRLQHMQALRGIKLLRKGNPVPIIVDLYKFRQSGNQDLNPYLENDDVIIFPTYNLSTSTVVISGSVNKPGEYLYVEGDRLQDVISFAGGLDPVYEKLPLIELSRLTYDGKYENIFNLMPNDDFELKAGDRISVNSGENNKKFFKVRIEGEVNKPGDVYITKSNTSLYDVIKKAGGIKSSADLTKAELIRGSLFASQLKVGRNLDNLMMLRMSAIADEDSVVFSIDNIIRLQRGNGVINFAKISDSTTHDAKFIVKDGDLINIPRQEDLVYVFGQINNPGYAKYAKDAKVDFYLQACGGIGETATKDIYLIKGKSRSWHLLDKNSDVEIEPGDYLWVPKKPIRNFDYYLNKVGSIASLVAGVATTIILLISL